MFSAAIDNNGSVPRVGDADTNMYDVADEEDGAGLKSPVYDLGSSGIGGKDGAQRAEEERSFASGVIRQIYHLHGGSKDLERETATAVYDFGITVSDESPM